ncbi:restriction endonuclease [Rhizobium leguminosarum]|uniref:restriction endonuclease n=1 Tax=Rhizobium leguminosarum TaxID=384 RepID=UPI001C940A52|nr:restriction endonuclease [Rhizobium leguminosarum]MBY5591663.1 restriction endonuclease [Rhizobium leguminosarum]
MPTLEQLFEALCRLLLRETGYQVQDHARRTIGFDIFAIKGSERLVVEVRWTHRPMVYKRLLIQWVPTTQALYFDEVATRKLMVSGTVDEDDIAAAAEDYGVVLMGRKEILDQAPDRLKALFEQYFAVSDREAGRDLPDSSARREILEELGRGIEEYNFGDKLGGQLYNVGRGKKDAKRYELLCMTITNYLFRDVLVEPKYQPYTEDRLSVLDIAYRISPNSANEVWRTISRDFRSRVIVFECKNYSKRMGPMQVYTTERYLSQRAMRSVCFLLTRLPPQPHAVLAAQAAMRESGKLLLILDDDDLRKMLVIRDKQLKAEQGTLQWVNNDPSDYIDSKIYELLASMPR